MSDLTVGSNYSVGAPYIVVTNLVEKQMNLSNQFAACFDKKAYGMLLRGEKDVKFTTNYGEVSVDRGPAGMTDGGDQKYSFGFSNVQRYLCFSQVGARFGIPTTVTAGANQVKNLGAVDTGAQNYNVYPTDRSSVTYVRGYSPQQNSPNYISYTDASSLNEDRYIDPGYRNSVSKAIAGQMLSALNARLYSMLRDSSGRPMVAPFSAHSALTGALAQGSAPSLGIGGAIRYFPTELLSNTGTEALGRWRSDRVGEAYVPAVLEAAQQVLHPAGGTKSFRLVMNTMDARYHVLGLQTRAMLAANSTSAPVSMNIKEDTFISKYLGKTMVDQDKRLICGAIEDIAAEVAHIGGIEIIGVDGINLEHVSGAEDNGTCRASSLLSVGVTPASATTAPVAFTSTFLTGAPTSPQHYGASSGIVGTVAPTAIANLSIRGLMPMLDYPSVSLDKAYSQMSSAVDVAFISKSRGNGDDTTGSGGQTYAGSRLFNQNTMITKPMAIQDSYPSYWILGTSMPQNISSNTALNMFMNNGNNFNISKGDILTVIPHATYIPYASYGMASAALNGTYSPHIATITFGTFVAPNLGNSTCSAADNMQPDDFASELADATSSASSFAGRNASILLLRIKELRAPLSETARHTNLPIAAIALESVIIPPCPYTPMFNSSGAANANGGLTGSRANPLNNGGTTECIQTSSTTIPGGFNFAHLNEYSLTESGALNDPQIPSGVRLSGGTVLMSHTPTGSSVFNFTNYVNSAASFNSLDTFGFQAQKAGSAVITPVVRALNPLLDKGIDPYIYHGVDHTYTSSLVGISCTGATNGLRMASRGAAEIDSNGNYALTNKSRVAAALMNCEAQYSGSPNVPDYVSQVSQDPVKNTIYGLWSTLAPAVRLDGKQDPFTVANKGRAPKVYNVMPYLNSPFTRNDTANMVGTSIMYKTYAAGVKFTSGISGTGGPQPALPTIGVSGAYLSLIHQGSYKVNILLSDKIYAAQLDVKPTRSPMNETAGELYKAYLGATSLATVDIPEAPEGFVVKTITSPLDQTKSFYTYVVGAVAEIPHNAAVIVPMQVR